MQVSERCLKAIQEWEGLRLSLYEDLNGFATIGYGHKLTFVEVQGHAYDMGISEVRAQVIFGHDAATIEAQVEKTLQQAVKQGQFDALVSFTFNLGLSRLQTLLTHGIDQVHEQLPRWVHAGGKEEPGLVERRKVELAWWQEA